MYPSHMLKVKAAARISFMYTKFQGSAQRIPAAILAIFHTVTKASVNTKSARETRADGGLFLV